MQSELNSGDVVVVDSELQPSPGYYVLIYLTQKTNSITSI
ncbi:hypothetical protein LDG_8047 [Legionella drancourtii LLAP12]|uniref:Uncharacterized protein n=1 Tax=Legionella drancourtii LLAP12 TaxID=658187 RepID=G9ERX7_9GAMM|nr:hypothetical protein LDG_8047 [Legionella drancourtii LLAP12]